MSTTDVVVRSEASEGGTQENEDSLVGAAAPSLEARGLEGEEGLGRRPAASEAEATTNQGRAKDRLAVEVESERRRLAERLKRLGSKPSSRGLEASGSPPSSRKPTSRSGRTEVVGSSSARSSERPRSRSLQDQIVAEGSHRSWKGPKRHRSQSTPAVVDDRESSPAGGRMTQSLSQSDLFALNDEASSSGQQHYEVGTAVEARWRSGPIYYRGKIAAARGDGKRFAVAFDDGSVECDVPAGNVRPFAVDAPQRSRAEIRDEMLKFYAEHNPSKLARVDELLDRCGAGNEEALLEAIECKYAGLHKNAVHHKSARRLRGTGYARAADAAVEAAFCATAAASRASARAEIYAIYADKRPTKVRAVDQLVARAGGSEHDLLAAIRCKYFPPSKTRPKGEFVDRRQVVREIARSEDEFALRLRTLDERIARPLRERPPDGPPDAHRLAARCASDVLKLVAECEGLSQLSEKLRADLALELEEEDRGGAPHRARVGLVFRRFGPFFKMFAAYARRFHETVQARAFLSGLGFFDDDDLDVSGALSAPVERVRDYQTLLAELVRLTPDDHADADDAKLAVAVVEQAVRHVDQTLQGDVAFKRLVQILEPSSLASLLDVPTRKLVKEGRLDLINLGATGGRVAARPVRCLALSDRLLLVALKRPKQPDISRLRKTFFPANADDDRDDQKQGRSGKGRLTHNLPLDDVVALEPCDDSFALSTSAKRLAAAADAETKAPDDERCDDPDDLDRRGFLFDDEDDDESLFRLETARGKVIVLRAENAQTRDAWLQTLAELRDAHAQLPRASDADNPRPPRLLRRDSDLAAPPRAKKGRVPFATRRASSFSDAALGQR